MIKRIITVLVFINVVFGTYAQSADIVFIEGWVDLKTGGEIMEAFEGDILRTGDSVITGDDSYAELSQKNLSTIKVQPNSVFTITEKEGDGGKETVLSTTVGSVSYKFGKLFGKEPKIATPSTIAGVRGTEFTVYAAEDGSSLVAVTSGLVTVSSQGKSVDLTADEGVEVKAGEAPGEKFTLKGRELDFSSWNNEKYNVLVSNPVAGLKKLDKQLDQFLADIKDYSATLKEMKAQKDEFIAEWNKLKDSVDKDKAAAYFDKNLKPLDLKLGPLYLNVRYYSLSALSFRRYILGKLYVDLKGRYFAEPGNPVYTDFLSAYKRILGKFERTVVPYLNGNDI